MNTESPKSKISKQFSKWALLDLILNKTYILRIGENLIGRANNNDITLNTNTMCSRIHAFITIKNETITYKDMSRNGSLIKTTIEFNQIKKSSAQIYENSEIKIGISKFKLIKINDIKSINIIDDNTESNNTIIINDDENPNNTNKNSNKTPINNEFEYENNNDESNETENTNRENMIINEKTKIININKDNKKIKSSKNLKRIKNKERIDRINLIIKNINSEIIELNNPKTKTKYKKKQMNENIEIIQYKINMIDQQIENTN